MRPKPASLRIRRPARHHFHRPVAVCLPVLLLATLLPPAETAPPPQLSQAAGHRGVVVSVSPLATEVGVAILRRGGNAVDAAIAVEFALAVTWPEAGNIGGGGFMMIHPIGPRPPVCVDYRETAPLAATRTLFAPDDGRWTHKMVGVPGTVRGMALAHEQFGSLDWNALVLPAVALAQNGFEISKALADSINAALNPRQIREGPHHRELLRVYGQRDPESGRLIPWKRGDRLVLPDLGRTLLRIAHEGPAGFYGGDVARRIEEEMKRGDGLITRKDLAQYEAKIRPAIHGTFLGHDIYGPPPPSSGGICLVLMLNMLKGVDLQSHDRFDARTLHLLAETMKRAFRDRALYLGDTDFVPSMPHLTHQWYADHLARRIPTHHATPSRELAGDLVIRDEPPQTTHFSVVDAQGMAVANTTTLEGSWGAHIVVRGAGFVLNNEMGDFNRFPGHTDIEGRIGTRPNQIEPGKRMLSSQTPVIVATNGRPVLVTGSPGGRSIINTSLQMVLNVLAYDMSLPEAMLAPRLHHGWLPDTVVVESFSDAISEETIEKLRTMGHEVTLRPPDSYQGDAHSIRIDPATGRPFGVADWRRQGKAAALP